MSARFLALLAIPLLLGACTNATHDPKTFKPTTSTTVQTPPLSFPNGPTNTAESAAPMNANDACEYLRAAVGQLSVNDRSVAKAVAFAQSATDSALAASANDPSYRQLRVDATALLVDVVRLQVQQQIQQHVSGGVVDTSRYPASYRETVRKIRADCR